MRKFLIKKTKHRPTNWLRNFLSSLYLRKINKAEIKVVFKSNCWYRVIRGHNDQLQKLFGFSNGLHTVNSNRIVWRPSLERNYIELFEYPYIDGVEPRPEEELVYLGKIQVEKEKVLPIYSKSGKRNWGYLLWPYFEGKDEQGAYQQMTILLDYKVL
jgi:hypothetical protein